MLDFQNVTEMHTIFEVPLHQPLFFFFFLAWATEVDPQKACQLFRENLLDRNSECPSLLLSINMFDEEEEQDSSFISFYKRNDVNWASPFRCRLKGINKQHNLFIFIRGIIN